MKIKLQSLSSRQWFVGEKKRAFSVTLTDIRASQVIAVWDLDREVAAPCTAASSGSTAASLLLHRTMSKESQTNREEIFFTSTRRCVLEQGNLVHNLAVSTMFFVCMVVAAHRSITSGSLTYPHPQMSSKISEYCKAAKASRGSFSF